MKMPTPWVENGASDLEAWIFVLQQNSALVEIALGTTFLAK